MTQPQPLTEMVMNHYMQTESMLEELSYTTQIGAFHRTMNTAAGNSYMPTSRDYDLEEGETEEHAIQRTIASDGLYSMEERSRLRVQTDQMLEAEQLASTLIKDHTVSVDQLQTAQEVKNLNIQHGVLSAQICLALGQEYEQWLGKFPPEDPHREEKAFYLTMRHNESQANMLALGLKDAEMRKDMALLNSPYADQHREGTFLKDLTSLKQMTMGEYFDKLMFNDDQRKGFIGNHNSNPANKPLSVRKNAYDYFVEEYEREEQKHLNFPEDEQKFARYVYKKYYSSIKENEVRLGQDLAISQMPPEMQKTAKKGAEMFNTYNYSNPKSIRSDIPVLDAMLMENRVDRINEIYQNISKAVHDPKTSSLLDVKSALAVLDPPAAKNKIDRYLQKHTGAAAISESPEKQRIHLAKAMAASVLKDSGKSYNVKRIHELAEDIASKDQFKDLTDRQVAESLFNLRNVKDARRDLATKLYGVPKSEQRDYINQMMNLSLHMVPGAGSSEKYQRMERCIKEIANLDPNDPDLDYKLIIANTNMIKAIDTYAKGKKSVRRNQEGIDKFDNCLDALSIVNSHVPGLVGEAERLVDRTNTVRKTKPGDKYYVNLNHFGASRAQEAHLDRMGEEVEDIGLSDRIEENKEVNFDL